MYNSRLQRVNSLLNLEGTTLWQYSSFTEAMDRALWSTTSSTSTVIPKIHRCENKRKRTLDESPSILCEQEREEEQCNEVDTYTYIPRYWVRHVTYHSFDTNQKWRRSIKNQISRHMCHKKNHRSPKNFPKSP